MTARGIVARVLYGLLFVVVVPVVLVTWARAAGPAINIPPVYAPLPGALVAVLGLGLIAAGGWALIARGHGLPMNAFPPERLVRTGVYRWLRNPMYIGFFLASAGVAITAGSAAGLWLVTPVAGLAAAALVFGYERHDLLRRFGAAALEPPLLSLPRGGAQPPSAAQRAAVFAWAFVPWLALWFGVQALGRPFDAFGTVLPFERSWPVLPWTELLYASAYLFIPLTVLVLRTQDALRRFAVETITGTVVIGLCWLCIPVVAENRAFTPDSALGRLLAYEQAHSAGVAAFPAFHVWWSLMAADAWTRNSSATGKAWWRIAGWTWAVAIAVSCLTTAMHSLVDVAAALVMYLLLRRPERDWAALRGSAERVANAWTEWRFGPVRVINHGVFAAAGAAAGVLVGGIVGGPDEAALIFLVGIGVLAGAGLTAQALEGSSVLLRPFGWYGGLAGGILAVLVAGLTGHPVLPLLTALGVAAPWIQVMGRLRCLVQGCCHGGPASERVGIHYRHRRSRVRTIAGLADVAVHPTPLYSIAGNVVIGVLLLRLRAVGAPESLILGCYFMLAGLARFVEESYRGEPQTPVLGGLRVYQWAAMASLLGGMAVTTIPSAAAPRAFWPPDAALIGWALALGLVFGAAMGVDFPSSNRRFSRLAASD